MTGPKDLHELNRNFYWGPDRTDNWRILRGDGDLVGDCDDYAATALWIAEGRSYLRWWWAVITLRAVFWYCKDPHGNWHLALHHKELGWIDNWSRHWTSALMHHNKMYPAILPIVAIKMLMGRLIG